MTNEINKKIINILYFKGEGVSQNQICNALEIEEKDFDKKIEEVKNILNNIGLDILIYKNGNSEALYKVVSDKNCSELLTNIYNTELEEDLTPAQLQTLTIISYMREISVAEISFIRGVQSSQTVRALSTRGLVKKIGNNYTLTDESFKILGIVKSEDLKDFEKINNSLKTKLSESLNG